MPILAGRHASATDKRFYLGLRTELVAGTGNSILLGGSRTHQIAISRIDGREDCEFSKSKLDASPAANLTRAGRWNTHGKSTNTGG